MAQDIDPYLEQQYNNRAAVPNFADFLYDWKTRSEEYQKRNGSFLNIPYGTRARELLDIFPAEDKNAPLHIFLHGGYWQALDKNSFSFMAETFNAKGETAIIVNYDLCPDVSVATITRQIQAAILWLYSERAPCSLNTNDIQITGHSAGGHLVAEMLCTDWRSLGLNQSPFKRATAISGLFDLIPITKTSVNTALGLSIKDARQNSPINRSIILTQPCALKLIVGADESDSYKSQSENIAKHWRQNGTASNVIFPNGKNHFSSLQDYLDNYFEPVTHGSSSNDGNLAILANATIGHSLEHSNSINLGVVALYTNPFLEY